MQENLRKKKYFFFPKKLKTIVWYSQLPISTILLGSCSQGDESFCSKQDNLFLFQICEEFQRRAWKSNFAYNDPMHTVST